MGRPRSPSLLSLPPDLTAAIAHHVSHIPEHPAGAGRPAASTVDAAGYARGAALAQTCSALAASFYTSLDAVTLPSVSTLDDAAVAALARRAGSATVRLVLRSCDRLGDPGVLAVAACMTSLRSVDLSFVPALSDAAVVALCGATAPRLQKLLLRRCTRLTDTALRAVAACARLETLDISHIGEGVTDAGVAAVAAGCGRSLRLLSMSNNPALGDYSLAALGAACPRLSQLCARSLPLVTDAGLEALCRGVGASARGLDLIDCRQLTKDAVVRCFAAYCPGIAVVDSENHSLRHVLISGLRTNIFIVRGVDPTSKQDTVHTCLVDMGDIASACILMAGTTDLSLVSLVLAKNFGTSLDSSTVAMLSTSYGLPTELLT